MSYLSLSGARAKSCTNLSRLTSTGSVSATMTTLCLVLQSIVEHWEREERRGILKGPSAWL